jgi:hypothetical protein
VQKSGKLYEFAAFFFFQDSARVKTSVVFFSFIPEVKGVALTGLQRLCRNFKGVLTQTPPYFALDPNFFVFLIKQVQFDKATIVDFVLNLHIIDSYGRTADVQTGINALGKNRLKP